MKHYEKVLACIAMTLFLVSYPWLGFFVIGYFLITEKDK